MLPLTALTLVLSALDVHAHPGEDHHAEALERRAALDSMGKRSLAHCSNQLAARGVHDRNDVRRRAIYNQLVQRAQLESRDISSALNTSHHSNITGVTANSSSSTFFTGTNQCILAPDVTEGPYYVTGELVRKNMTESQAGVPVFLDVQIIDTNTCQPLPNVALDFWHCNATGVYSGVVANGNGNSDPANINATFLRGIQTTDTDGVAQFISIVPGHYTGRTNHIHVMAHTEGNYEIQANQTITGGTKAAHVGQLFFDQSLLTEVQAVAPYSTNTQTQTTNAEDNIMAQEGANFDPVVEYVLLGDSVAQGIFAWISIGINGTASNTVQAAATFGESGGVANANSMGGGPGGGSGGSGGSGGPGGAPPGRSGSSSAPSASGSNAGSASSASQSAAGSGSIPAQSSNVPFLALTVLLLVLTPFAGLV